MCQSQLLSYECFTLKIFLLGRTQCQEFDCLYRAKRYCHPCTLVIEQIYYRALILHRKKFCFIQRLYFFMQKMKNLIFIKTTLYITTKIQDKYKMGYVTQQTAGSKSVSIEFNFWREIIHDFSSDQISYCATVANLT